MPTFIDIGAFKGEITRRAVSQGYMVHAFEPNPNMKKYLVPLEKMANINYVAAWNEDGKASLHLMRNTEPGEDGVSLLEEKSNVSLEKMVEVKTINIGKYLKDLDEDIDVLKINAEGAEYVIIESILSEFDYKRIKRWLVEDHTNYIESDSWNKKRVEVLARAHFLRVNIEPWENQF